MNHGGRRPGAGRKRGSGTAKKTRAEAERILTTAGITPLGYMQGVLDGSMVYDEVKFKAAVAAAPFVHARLAAVEHSGSLTTRRATEVSDDELANIAAGRSEGTAEAPIDPAQLN